MPSLVHQQQKGPVYNANTDRGDGAGEMGDALTTVNLGAGRTALQLAVGELHSCALLDNYTVKCWGRNNEGQLGQGTAGNLGKAAGEMEALAAIDLDGTPVQVAAGQRHTCALLNNGRVKCWGRNDLGQLGVGSTGNRGDAGGEMGANLPVVDLGTGRTATKIWAGQNHNCALLDNDTVKCWGFNSFGQLGLGHADHIGDGAGEMGDSLSAVDVGSSLKVRSMSLTANTSCAVLNTGNLKCWGRGAFGALGLEDVVNRGDTAGQMGNNLSAVSLGAGRTVIQSSAMANSACALLDDGSIKCWGDNDFGQLGQENVAPVGRAAGEMGDNLAVTPVQ